MLNLGIFPFFHFHKSLFLYRSQASEDARRIVDEERTNARMEIENARAAVQRVQKVLQEKENSSQRIGKQVNCISNIFCTGLMELACVCI